MYRLKTSAAFDSAHFLAGYRGKCANLHGHRWTVEVEAGAEQLQESGEKRGMVIDETGSLKAATLAALQDEGFRLIEVPYRPTAEHFAKAFYEKLKADGIPVLRVTVYETPDNCAGYEV